MKRNVVPTHTTTRRNLKNMISEQRHTNGHMAGCHSYGMSRTGKSMEMERSQVVVRGWGRRNGGSDRCWVHVTFGTGRGDICTTL